jgi:nicotinate-nucleotide pyrophosphorylase (carboxylating)
MLIKDNHIKVAGGIRAALERARAYASHMTKIEIEVEDLAGVEEALAGKADVIMLDNMAPDMMAEAVRLIDHRAVVEASGGIDETTLAAAAESGVDVISVGALTHSVKALDISMDIGRIK